MWHNFILFSAEYTNYCNSYFGRYIHHAPTSHDKEKVFKLERETDPEGVTKKMMDAQQEQFSFIFKKLGVETLFKWYVEYPERYNQVFFEKSYKSIKMNWTPSTEMKKIVTLFKIGKVKIRVQTLQSEY